jgi:riboflavin synthase
VFTGIIEELGTVASFEPRDTGARLTIHCTKVTEDLTEGASIAVNGVCLTALSPTVGSFVADLAPETLSRSNLGALKKDSRVNLERAVTPVTRLSGHIVQGHVDATGEVLTFDSLGDGNYWLRVQLPAVLDRYLVEKGSISIDGISLTIARLEPGPIVNITIIPHTAERTTLGAAKAGTRVNAEVDVLAKHVEKLLASQRDVGAPMVR